MYKRKYPVDDKVIIEIEDKKFSCSRKKLCKKSDYFYAMFHDDFIEKDKKSITIQDVPENGFKNCLSLIGKEIKTVEYDQILETLHCACILQFAEIKQHCINKFKDDIPLKYCLDVWHMTELLDIHPLCEKAKCLALLEFNKIKEMNCILQISLKQLHLYLANHLIYCDNELDIFQTGMNWWYENSSKLQESENWSETDTNKHLYTILSCVDFKALTKINVNQMTTLHDICDNKEIKSILLGIIILMDNPEAVLSKEIEKQVKNLYFNTKSRNRELLPCIVTSENPLLMKQNFERSTTKERNVNISYYDDKTKSIQKLGATSETFASICSPSVSNILYKVLPYHQNLILFGGEFPEGSFNSHVWKLRTFQDDWELVTRMPKERRHSVSCIVNDKLFIIGGIEKHTVRNTGMLFYDFKEDHWIECINLPYSCFDVKVCEYKNQLLVIPAVGDNQYGYIFNFKTFGWLNLTIQFPPNFKFCFTKNFVLFSKDDSIYLKASPELLPSAYASAVIEMKVDGSNLKVVNFSHTEELRGDICNYFSSNDNFYIFTKHKTTDSDHIYQLHRFNLTSKNNELLVQINDSIDQGNQEWHIERSCFPFFHYNLTKDLKCISEFSL